MKLKDKVVVTLYLKQCVKVSFEGWVWQAD